MVSAANTKCDAGGWSQGHRQSVALGVLACWWSLDILNALRSHFSLPFPDTLSHTLSELPEFTSNVRSRTTAGLRQSTGFCGPGGVLDQYLRQKICLGGSGCREGIAGRDRDKCRQGNAAQDQRHGGWILNPERQSGRQSEDKVRELLDSCRLKMSKLQCGAGKLRQPAAWKGCAT